MSLAFTVINDMALRIHESWFRAGFFFWAIYRQKAIQFFFRR
jgi:hypothetical protein